MIDAPTAWSTCRPPNGNARVPSDLEGEESTRHLTTSEFAELFPVHCASWEREPGQSDGDFVQSYRPRDWWLTRASGPSYQVLLRLSMWSASSLRKPQGLAWTSR